MLQHVEDYGVVMKPLTIHHPVSHSRVRHRRRVFRHVVASNRQPNRDVLLIFAEAKIEALSARFGERSSAPHVAVTAKDFLSRPVLGCPSSYAYILLSIQYDNRLTNCIPTHLLLLPTQNQTPTSSPSTRASMRSDIDIDMDDDDGLLSPPIPKRKADDSPANRRAPKLPRLHLSTSQPPNRGPLPSSSGTDNPAAASSSSHASYPLHGPGREHKLGRRVEPLAQTLSNSVERFHKSFKGSMQRRRKKEKEKQKQKEHATQPRRPALGTARKRTCKPTNFHRISTATLLRGAQKSKLRLNLDGATARSRPLDTVRNREEVIELTDSSSAASRPRPYQASNTRGGAGSVATLAANKNDPIIITSGSEDDWLGPSQTQTRRNRNRPPASTQSKDGPRSKTGSRAPPPPGADVISLTDSDEDVPPRSAPVPTPSRPAPSHMYRSTAKDRVPPPTRVSQPVPAVPAPRPPAPTPVAHQPPRRLEKETPRPLPDPDPVPAEPSYDSPPDDMAGGAFAHFDFDAADGDQSGELDGGVNLGPSPGPETGVGAEGRVGSPVVITFGKASGSLSASAPVNAPPPHRSEDGSLPVGDHTTPPSPSGVPSTTPPFDTAPQPEGAELDAHVHAPRFGDARVPAGDRTTPPSLPGVPLTTPEDALFDSYINMEGPDAVDDRGTEEAKVGGGPDVTGTEMEAESAVGGRTPENGRAGRRGFSVTAAEVQIHEAMMSSRQRANNVGEREGGGHGFSVATPEVLISKAMMSSLERENNVGERGGDGLIDRGGDVNMEIEEGEVDPNDMPGKPRTPRTPETPESGEIVSGSGCGSSAPAQVETQGQGQPSITRPSHISHPAPTRLGPTPTIPDLSHPVTSTSSSSSPALIHPATSSTSTAPSSANANSSILPRSSSASNTERLPNPVADSCALVLPDISSYKGIRFKRAPHEARENSFFSRVLGGMRSLRKGQ
ncbi:hypothetical protein BU15DRAFT_69279, partial [Melanogaster broomeanus]